MKEKLTTYNIILIIVLVISLGLLFVENASAITGNSITEVTSSNVSISAFYAIDWSNNITSGIIFETITALPITDDNATGNYIDPATDNSTDYWANVSLDGNVAVDFCIYADAGMDNGGTGVIGLANETYATNVTSSNFTLPSAGVQIPFTTTSTEAASQVYPGNYSYWRFWLDVQVGQEVGDYSNAVSFKAISEGETCI